MEHQDLQQLQEAVRQHQGVIQLIKTEMGRIIAGQDELIERLLLAMIANGHVLLEGVPGIAKTMAVRTLAQAVSCTFARVQFTPDLLPADLIGTNIYDAATHEFSTRLGPVFANIVLADEINRAPAKVQSALLEAMQEKQITIAGKTFAMPKPFLVLATQNPIEQEGTYPLPEAQLDRFMFKLKVNYPRRSEEGMVIRRMAHPSRTTEAVAVAKLDDIASARELVDQIYMDEKIVDYILDLVIATRPGRREELSDRQSPAKIDGMTSFISLGASPRASIALALAAKGMAFIGGRAYVVPQDVKAVAPDVLRHRLRLSYEAEAENIDADTVIRALLDELRTP